MTSLAAAALTLCPLSCTMEAGPSEGGAVSVEFIVDAPPTKAVDERAVHSVDLLVFRHDGGQMEAHVREESGSAQASLPSGMSLDWALVCNVPEGALDGMSSLGELRAHAMRLEDDGDGVLAMTAWGTGTFGADSRTVHAEAGRLLSRVTVGTVDPAYLRGDASRVILTRAFLTNVAGTCPLSAQAEALPDAGHWLNRQGLQEDLPGTAGSLLVRSIGADLSGGRTAVAGASLYCYPNAHGTGVWSDSAPQWCARGTRLVLEVDTPGGREYYPIDICAELERAGLGPRMECNTSYDFTMIRLDGPGSSSPDEPAVRSSITFTLSLTPWTDSNIDLEL